MKEVTLSVENESETEEGVDEPVRYPVTDIYGFCNSSRKKKTMETLSACRNHL